ncbi:hypothetical protein C7C45_23860 [Micromonospora arborensis]|uniref:Uncharacterized protein n=1 Tax=Micromonospora arborensis TaxID=2116518 RepID=A0A318NXD6_9ACTN|nr:DUF6297 family protein [Micromonospora arborensis]PYC66679.1 hypothetical protein C7C45_23860 [Micromonospora arborensis]
MSAAPAVPLSARAVRRWLRTRQVRQAREQWSSDGLYTVGLAVVFLLVTIGAAVRGYLLHADETGPATTGAVLAVALGSVAVLLAAAAVAGPLGAGAAALSWLATSPMRRAEMLRPRFVAVLGAGLVGGLPMAVLAARPVIVAPALALGVATAAAAVLVQTSVRDPARVLRMSAAVCGVAAVAVGLLGVAPAVTLPAVPVAVIAVLIAGVLAFLAARQLDAVRTATLRAAASSVLAVTGGVAAADPGLLSRVSEDHRWQRHRLRGRFRLPAGPSAIPAHDVITLLRMPSRALLIAAVAPVPALIDVAPAIRAMLWLACGLFAVAQVTGNVRYDADRSGLGRLLGRTDGALLRLRAVVPVGVAVIWGAASVAVVVWHMGGEPAWGAALGAATGPALAAGALRSGRRSLVRHDYPLIVTPQGVVPSGPLLWVAQAFDVALIGTIPALAGIAADDFGGVAVAIQAVLSVATLTAFLSASATHRARGRLGRSTRAAVTRAVTVIWRL